MTEPHPLRRSQLELIALTSDPDRQAAKLKIFFPGLDQATAIERLAEYRHLMVMQDADQARQIITELIDMEARP